MAAMDAPDTATHLNYMTDAAHLLAFTASETSAYVMTRRNGFMLANNLQLSDIQREHVCGACGHIMILGYNSTMKLENEKALRAKKRHGGPASGKALPTKTPDTQAGPSKVVTCKNCGRYTKLQFQAPGPVSRKRTAAALVTKAEEARRPPSASASSKKRAKNRKAGLQALLDQSQASRSGAKPGLGLSLSDFMKK